MAVSPSSSPTATRKRPARKVSPTGSWTRALAEPAREFAPTAIETIAGMLPTGLRGALYRNGPARLQRGDRWVGHWFDGDGAVLRVNFDGRDARAVYRFVQTEAYRRDAASETWTQGSYGMKAPQATLTQPGRERLRHPANTSVLALPDRVLALWEQGHPYVLDPETLEPKAATASSSPMASPPPPPTRATPS